VRLDTAYTFADVNTLRRYSLGDFISGGLAWTRPVRLAGVQIRSDFSMRPDLITFPLPSVSGSTAVPSTVQVLANGSTVFSQPVDAGPFQIPKLPVVNGASTISMTVTNALGQQVTVTQPFYASTSLLAPGLQTFSGQAGLVRREWGYLSNDYGKLAGIAEYRRGLTPELTVEGSAEGTSGTVMAGGGAVVRVGSIGVLNAAMAASGGSGVKGVQGSLGFQRTATRFSFGVSELLSTRGYQDVAALNGDPVLRQQLSASSGVSLKRFGSLGVAYAAIRQDPSLHPLPFYTAIDQNATILSVGYSLQLRHTSIYANYFRTINNDQASGVQVGVTIPFGRRSSVSISEGSDEGYGEVQVQKSAAEIGEWGYDTYISAEQPAHEFSQLQYKSRRGLFTGGIDQNGSQTTLRVETQGALSFVDGAFFLSNTIYDSFAIVDTNGLPNVGVLQENRDVGNTNARGLLLVPDLRAFDLNHLGINPTDVPLDTTIDADTRTVRPQDRSGVVVRFPVKVSHGALLRLIDSLGAPLPVGSTVTLRATRAAFPVGYEGKAYIEDLGRDNEVDAELPDGGHCSVKFVYLPVKGVIPTIGPLRCLEERR
jgi:outer membrane usher protein